MPPPSKKRMAGETLRLWSDLPDEALHIILTCLCSYTDFISFSLVCRSWHAVFALSPSPTTSLFPPLLLRPTFETGTNRLSSLRLFDIANPSFSSSLSRFANKFSSISFLSYSHGCLLRLSKNKRQVIILNPFTGDEICSPIIPLSPLIAHPPFGEHYPVLTSPLSSPDSVLVLPVFAALWYWRIGSPSWTKSQDCFNTNYVAMPVATIQGKVYASETPESMYVLDFSPEFILRVREVEGVEESIQQYMVDCGGELLSLQLVRDMYSSSTHLELFWLDSSADEMRWVKKETLGNWAIFVGCESGVPGIAVENPERWGGRSNCVYFATEDDYDGLIWMVLELGDEVFPWDEDSPLYGGKFAHKLSTVWVPPGF